MPKVNMQELGRLLGGDAPPQQIMLCGEDVLRVETIEKRIVKKLTDGGALSDTVFDGSAPDLDRLADACGFCPMFQPYNIIIIRDLDPDTVPAAQIDALLEIIKDPAPRVIVLLVMRTVPAYEVKRDAPVFLPKFKKIASFFEKQGVLCICEKKNAFALAKTIQESAARAGVEFPRQLAEELANRCLCDSKLISAEMAKLLACADGGSVTREMLDALVAPLPDADAFALARAVTGGRGASAMQLLAQLTAKSEDTKTILSLLSRITAAFTDLYRAKLGQGAGKQTEQITADFGYPKNREFAVRNALRDAGALTREQLRTCVRILRQTDRECKSSRTPPRLLLEQAIVRMLRVRRDGTEDIG